MFAINLLLISYATPEAYGRFVIVFALSLLAFGVQNALVLMPINVLIPGRSEEKQRATLRMLSTVDLAVLVLSTISIAFLAYLLGLAPSLVAASALLVIGSMAREIARSTYVTYREPMSFLKVDLAAVTIASLAIYALWHVTVPEVAALVGMAIGSAASAFLFGPTLYRAPADIAAQVLNYRSHWRNSRWALLGAGLTEGQLRLYVYVVEAFRGPAVLATLHAGRVLVNPASMVAFAWTRAMRPILAGHIEEGNSRRALQLTLNGLCGLVGLAIVYLLTLHLGWSLIETYFLRGQYADLKGLINYWSIFTLLNVQTICITVYFQARNRFRDLTLVIGISVAVSSALLFLLAFDFSISTAITALIIGEIVMLAGFVVLLVQEFRSFRAQTT